MGSRFEKVTVSGVAGNLVNTKQFNNWVSSQQLQYFSRSSTLSVQFSYGYIFLKLENCRTIFNHHLDVCHCIRNNKLSTWNAIRSFSSEPGPSVWKTTRPERFTIWKAESEVELSLNTSSRFWDHLYLQSTTLPSHGIFEFMRVFKWVNLLALLRYVL